jgi:glycerol-3-phosphate acyltransferase PlsX
MSYDGFTERWQSMIRIAVDGMGGDNAPGCMIDGAAEALKKSEEIEIFLVGRKEVLEPALVEKGVSDSRLHVVPASEVIETAEKPTEAIRNKKDSSMVVGLKMVKSGDADCFVSCGSTGALLVGGQVLAGRLKGVRRSPLATLIPTVAGRSLLLDCGANVDARATDLVQFARMGSIYMEHVVGVKNPTVGIVNIGAEEEKGNALVKETFPLLKACTDINFVGSVEARDIPMGGVDVMLCEAFVGNVVLKMYEGTAMALFSVMKKSILSSARGKIGGMLIRPALHDMRHHFSSDEYGGAPMLGLKGLVVKAHGNSTGREVCTAILQCIAFSKADIAGKIEASIGAAQKAEAGGNRTADSN